ncbi:MAG TPA: ABC transporter permease [Streptosporangiaceae bacterium]|nr:ABC transporter permease [Streptosporangiaceae bacterium]
MSQALTIARHRLPHSAAPAWESFGDALRAEWTKMRTMPGTAWILAGICALTVAVSAGTDAATKCTIGGACAADTTRLTLTGIEVGQALVAVLAVLAITGEYSTGMIRTTFAAMPRRSVVLAAKASVLTCLVLPAAVVAVAGSLAAGWLILPGNGFTAVRGFALVSLAHGPTVRAAVGSVLYLALIGLLSLAIATMVRDSAVATGSVLGLLYVAPIASLLLAGQPVWQRRVQRYAPVNSGLTIEDTTGLRHLPIGPWGGLGVLAIWAAASLLTAALALRLRDA